MSNAPVRSVLGVYLTPHMIEAVLLRATDDRPEVVHRFARPRGRRGEPATMDEYATALPGLKSSDDIDFTLQVGGGGDDLSLDPALRDLQSGDGASVESSDGAAATRPFPTQLTEILKECAALGHPSPEITFCAGAPDVGYVEITDADDAPRAPASWAERLQDALPFGGDSGRRARLARTRAVYGTSFDGSRAAFVPMTPTREGDVRHLAVLPTAAEAVTPTLNALFSEQESLRATARHFESELTLYAGLVRRYLAPKPADTTAVVRVGTDDTLLLFMTGAELRHVERLRSLTTYDAPDTIASRVLLYQDEQKIGDLDAILLVGGPPDDRLKEGFAAFYPEAAVGRLPEFLTAEWVTGRDPVLSTLTPESGPALAAALQLLNDDQATSLLGTFTRRQRRMAPAFAWHTVLMLLVLTAATLFFVWRYVDQAAAIDEMRARIDQNPIASPEMSPEMLRARVDSIQGVHRQYTRSLHVLDSLLLGSTEWSTTIEKTARETRNVSKVWFEDWDLTASTITLKGNALDRSNLAELARNLDGTVHHLAYAEIDGRRVYPFRIEIPRSIEMPEAALRLRERSLSPDDADAVVPVADASRASGQ